MPPGKPKQATSGAPSWRIWTRGATLCEMRNITPLLASWNANANPEQIKVQRYLDDLQAAVGILPNDAGPLFLHMAIDVKSPERLVRHHDLENYLFPIVYRFGASHFSLVSATKGVGGGSTLRIGRANLLGLSPSLDGWGHFSHHAGSGAMKKEWKAGIRDALIRSRVQRLPPGPVAVHLAWRCSSQRNWAQLWKPTGDAMGPVLGESAHNPFSPADDRIVSLGLHWHADDSMGHNVDVGMWWRRAVRE